MIQGYVIPTMWYHTLLNDNGRPNMLAIALLADIVNGFQIREKRDDSTGEVIRLEKNLCEDLLIRSYLYYEELFNENHKNIQRAIAFLEKKDIIKRKYRVLQGSNGKFKGSVLLLHINLDTLFCITYPKDLPNKTKKNKQKSGLTSLNGDKVKKMTTGHQCPRCTRCLFTSQKAKKEDEIDIELVELAVQKMVDMIYEDN